VPGCAGVKPQACVWMPWIKMGNEASIRPLSCGDDGGRYLPQYEPLGAGSGT
jgi:hypothetical protein